MNSSVTLLRTSARRMARDAISSLYHIFGLSLPVRAARGTVTILTFHRVLPEKLRASYPMPDLAVTPDELDFILSVATRHYTAGALSAVMDRHTAGELPAKPFLAITFDDGQLDNLQHALPVLDRHGVRATFFAVTDATERNEALWHDRLAYACERCDPATLRELMGPLAPADLSAGPIVNAAKALRPAEREDLTRRIEAASGGRSRPAWDGIMTWQQLRQLQDAGHEIGAHTRTHPILTLSTAEELTDEIEACRQVFTNNLAAPVDAFCYPNGDCDARVVDVVQRSGYRYATSTRAGLNPSGADKFALRRFDMQGRYARRANGEFDARPLLYRLTRSN